MRIALVYPNIGRKGDSLFMDGACMEPLGPAVIAGLTPAGVETVLIDDRLEEIPYCEPFDLVAITVQIFTARRSYEIADGFRSRGVPVALGGIHVALATEEAAAHADTIVMGDAEQQWPSLVDDLRHGSLKPRYLCQPAGRPQNGTLPCRDLFAGKKYLPVSLIQYSRGCTNSCSFCASSVYFGRRHSVRDPGEVVREIQGQDRKLLFFVDDNIVADKAAAKELFRALIPLKVRWVSQASMDMLDDGELMGLMVKSGCLGHVIGFESIGAAGIDAMNKSANEGFIADQYAYAIKELRRHGLQTWAAFTVGHDTDTIESIRETCAFALRNKFTFAAFNILNPYPGTSLYTRLENEGRLLYGGRWWLHPEYRFNYAAFTPKNMAADELTEAAFWCRRAFNSPPSIIRRAFEPHTNLRTPYRLLTYMLYNPLFRREVFNKQGITFGYEGNQR
ncbi:MAG: radical SAM protein [Clostridiales bacterium]|nr:radical SAM protein [Clostridiales bacterium]